MAVQQRPPKPIKLVLADVDGTLVTKDKVLTDRAAAAVKRLGQAGIGFAITSGRPPRGMAMLLDPLDIKTPIAGFNGGLFTKHDLSVIEQHTVPDDIAAKAVKQLLDLKLDVWIYRGNDWLIRDASAPHVEREAFTVQFKPTVVANFDDALKDVAKIVGISDDLDLVARAESEVQTALGSHASAARSQPYYLDITHPDANKGTVVQTLSRMLGIDPEAIATIGDMPNDVLMFKQSGFSIAMGNASAEVQRQATVCTEDYEHEGFAKAIEQFILTPGHQAAAS